MSRLLQAIDPGQAPGAVVQPCVGGASDRQADSKAALPKGGTNEEGRPHCPPTEFSPWRGLLSIRRITYCSTPATRLRRQVLPLSSKVIPTA